MANVRRLSQDSRSVFITSPGKPHNLECPSYDLAFAIIQQMRENERKAKALERWRKIRDKLMEIRTERKNLEISNLKKDRMYRGADFQKV